MTLPLGTIDLAAEVLDDLAGLALDSSGRQRLEDALRAETMEWELAEDVVASLRLDAALFQRVIDAVTLQETRFFRDPLIWDALAHTVLPTLHEPLELWCAGCADGQEAYSLAMLLLEFGRISFRISATDISRAALARASAATYGASGLRGLDEVRLARFTVPDGPGRRRIVPEVRERVDFSLHNIARDRLPPAVGRTRLVLCRNVLIYLSAPAATDFLHRLRDALPEGGLLIAGSAESLWHLSRAFAPLPFGDGFAYRAIERRADGPAPRPVPPVIPPAPPAAPSRYVPRPRATPAAAPPPAASPPGGVPFGGVPSGPAAPSAVTSGAVPPGAVSPGPVSPGAVPELEELLAEGARAIVVGDTAGAVASFRRAVYVAPDSAVAHLHLGLALEALEDPGALRAFRAARRALGGTDPAALDVALGGYSADVLADLIAEKLGDET